MALNFLSQATANRLQVLPSTDNEGRLNTATAPASLPGTHTGAATVDLVAPTSVLANESLAVVSTEPTNTARALAASCDESKLTTEAGDLAAPRQTKQSPPGKGSFNLDESTGKITVLLHCAACNLCSCQWGGGEKNTWSAPWHWADYHSQRHLLTGNHDSMVPCTGDAEQSAGFASITHAANERIDNLFQEIELIKANLAKPSLQSVTEQSVPQPLAKADRQNIAADGLDQLREQMQITIQKVDAFQDSQMTHARLAARAVHEQLTEKLADLDRLCADMLQQIESKASQAALDEALKQMAAWPSCPSGASKRPEEIPGGLNLRSHSSETSEEESDEEATDLRQLADAEVERLQQEYDKIQQKVDFLKACQESHPDHVLAPSTASAANKSSSSTGFPEATATTTKTTAAVACSASDFPSPRSFAKMWATQQRGGRLRG